MMGREYRKFGPPGCGKTQELARLVKAATEQRGHREILVASFTRSAASTIASRVELLPEQVGTLHAHCYRVLGRPDIADTKAADFNAEHPEYALSAGGPSDLDESAVDALSAAKTGGDALYLQYQILRAKMTPPALWPPNVQGFAQAWEDFKRSTDAMDFTDLIAVALSKTDEAPGSPTIGFFDEVQDFTRLELSLVRKWGRHMDIILAGDDDQCIYSFKGATPDAFLDPPIPEEDKQVLGQSFRVPRAVQVLAQGWIEQLSRREPKTYKPRAFEGEVRRLRGGDMRAVEGVMADAQQYLDQGKSVMFLTACGYMLDNLKAILRAHALPFFNPYRRSRGDWNPLGGGNGVSASERVLAFLRPREDIFGEDAMNWTYQDLAAWGSVVKSDGVFRRGGKTALTVWAKERQGIVPLEAIEEVFEPEVALELTLGGADLEWLEANLLGSRSGTMQFPLAIAKKLGPLSLKMTPKVIIGTIHSVKGGEADVVYLFPDLSMAGYREWIAPGDGHDSVVRQFYVGMTRAREVLVLCPNATSLYAEFPFR